MTKNTLTRQRIMILPVLLICLWFLLNNWLNLYAPNVQLHTVASSKQHADWFVEDVTTTTFSNVGKPIRKIQAKQLRHFNVTQKTFIDKPRFELFKPNMPAWQLTAETGVAQHGQALSDIQDITLKNNVTLWRNAYLDHSRVEMTTASLKVLPSDNIASTQDTVVFKQVGHQIVGQGMIAKLDKEYITLLNHVAAQHMPTTLVAGKKGL